MRYYTPQDVALHNCAEDCWISLFGQVFDLTEMVLSNRGPFVDSLIMAAGTDVSHWFSIATPAQKGRKQARSVKTGKVIPSDAANLGGNDGGKFSPRSSKQTYEPRTYVNPQTGLTVPYLPMGRFLHVPPNFPTTKWRTNLGLPWWRDQKRVIGKLTRKARPLRVLNVLTQQEGHLLVACEDTMDDILERYLEQNAHARSYTWKVLQDGAFVPAVMGKTLEENGIVDDDLELERLGLDEDGFTPVIHIYFNDDLTIA
ncbi:unnamed protein product [Ascophyllum nodosum]